MVLEVVAEEGGGGAMSRRHLLHLRERNRGQARLLLSARTRMRHEMDLSSQLQKERDLNLRTINSQLLLLEANLRRRQEELSTLLRAKDLTIRHQQRLIVALASACSQISGQTEIFRVLANTSKEDPDVDLPKILKEILTEHVLPHNTDASAKLNNSSEKNELIISRDIPKDGIPSTVDETNSRKEESYSERVKLKEEDERNNNNKDLSRRDDLSNEMITLLETSLTTPERKPDADSVTDTDSAIMLEDTCSDSLVILPSLRDGVKVIRSVSDVLESAGRPLQLPPINGCQLLHSTCTTPTNSPPTTPRMDDKAAESLFTGFSQGSLSSTPSCSSSEESDESPTCTLNKERCTSVETVHAIGHADQTRDKMPLNRSLSESPQTESQRDSSISESLLFINSKNSLKSSEPIESLLNVQSNISDDSSAVWPDLSPSLTLASQDSDSTLSEGASDTEIDDAEEKELEVDTDNESPPEDRCQAKDLMTPDRRLLLGSFENLEEVVSVRPCAYKKVPDELIQVTYNRVMSNHRSVTKVKDVKYKRINKAKSRSLEELRGKLRIHEGKPKPCISVSIGHSYA